MRDKARRIVLILGLVLVLVGAGVLLYPRFTAFRYAQEVSRQKESFLEQVAPEEAQEPDPRLEELYEKLAEENQRLYEEHQPQLVDPFSYEQPAIDLSEYGLEDGVIGYLTIDKMGIELPIYLGANPKNMTLGAAKTVSSNWA